MSPQQIDPEPNAALDPHAGCADYARASRLSRRGFLQGMAAGTGAMVATQVFGDALMEASFGATGGNVLVVLSFRGGIDGLGMVVPHGDPAYYLARPQLAVPRASVLAADPMFGFHPAMAPLLPLWRAKRLAAVHAVGLKVPNRSHFQAMELVEDADPTSSVRRGWVNRMIGLDGLSQPHEAIALGSATEPAMMAGPAPTLATSGFDQLQLPGLEHLPSRRYAATSKVWGATTSPLGAAARSAMTVSKGLGTSLGGVAYRPAAGADYPDTWPARDLSDALKDSAQLIKANLGTTVISIDFGSWDMHADYGTLDWGEMQSMTGAFASSVAAFFRDLGPLGDRVTLATISEFGRRVTQNGNRGLDHGWGNMMLVMGGGVRGGQYYGSWPGLGVGNLLAGDLAVTTDYRDVLGEVIGKRFPDRSLAQVFPGLKHAPVGLMH